MQVQVRDVGFGFSPFPHELSRDPSISLQAKGLFAVYGSFVSVTDPTAWPSEDYICRLCGGLAPKTFRKYKKELIQAGWISSVQRQRENGQYSTLSVTRYYHPSMNPLCVSISTDGQKTTVGKSSTISTDGQKTAVPFSAVPKLPPQEQETKVLIKNHKNTQEPCVISEEQKACIDWIIESSKKQKMLKNEGGLRRVLENCARMGTLVMDQYHAHKQAEEQAQESSQAILERAQEWKRTSEENPPNWAELRALHPNLFKGRRTGGDPATAGGTPPGRRTPPAAGRFSLTRN